MDPPKVTLMSSLMMPKESQMLRPMSEKNWMIEMYMSVFQPKKPKMLIIENEDYKTMVLAPVTAMVEAVVEVVVTSIEMIEMQVEAVVASEEAIEVKVEAVVALAEEAIEVVSEEAVVVIEVVAVVVVVVVIEVVAVVVIEVVAVQSKKTR